MHAPSFQHRLADIVGDSAVPDFPDATGEADITIPDGDPDAANTTNDGEVTILKRVLRLINGYMRDNKHRNASTRFTLASNVTRVHVMAVRKGSPRC